jgi:hypothetical protein
MTKNCVERAAKQPISGIDMLRMALCYGDTHIPGRRQIGSPPHRAKRQKNNHSGQKQAS